MTESLLARNDGKPVVVARSKASAERRSNLAKSLSDGRERLLRLLARKDGKIIVVARSKAIAERRGNLAKSLVTGGRDCHAYWLARTQGGEIATPALKFKSLSCRQASQSEN